MSNCILPMVFPTMGGENFTNLMNSIPLSAIGKVRMVVSIADVDDVEDLIIGSSMTNRGAKITRELVTLAHYHKNEKYQLSDWRNKASNYLIANPEKSDHTFHLEMDDDFLFANEYSFDVWIGSMDTLIGKVLQWEQVSGDKMGSICCRSNNRLNKREKLFLTKNLHSLGKGILLRTDETHHNEIHRSTLEDQTVSLNMKMRGLQHAVYYAQSRYLPIHEGGRAWEYEYTKILLMMINSAGQARYISILGERVHDMTKGLREDLGRCPTYDEFYLRYMGDFAIGLRQEIEEAGFATEFLAYMKHVLVESEEVTELQGVGYTRKNWGGARGFGIYHPEAETLENIISL